MRPNSSMQKSFYYNRPETAIIRKVHLQDWLLADFWDLNQGTLPYIDTKLPLNEWLTVPQLFV